MKISATRKIGQYNLHVCFGNPHNQICGVQDFAVSSELESVGRYAGKTLQFYWLAQRMARGRDELFHVVR